MKSLMFWKNWQVEWVLIWLYSVFTFFLLAVTAIFKVENFADRLTCWVAAIGFSSIMPLVLYFSGRRQRKHTTTSQTSATTTR